MCMERNDWEGPSFRRLNISREGLTYQVREYSENQRENLFCILKQML